MHIDLGGGTITPNPSGYTTAAGPAESDPRNLTCPVCGTDQFADMTINFDRQEYTALCINGHKLGLPDSTDKILAGEPLTVLPEGSPAVEGRP